jgi:hypothetical protein
MGQCVRSVFVAMALLAFGMSAAAQGPEQPATQSGVISCVSPAGGRQHCDADTSQGVVLLRNSGAAQCLLGRNWGYDQTGIWVSDGCGGDFVAGRNVQVPAGTEAKAEAPKNPLYIPNLGVKLVDTDYALMYVRLFTYVRYLNQLGLDPSYTDSFGKTKSVVQRQDFQIQKFFLPFSGWFLDKRMKYYLYVWSSNASQGDPAQVVGAGNISWQFNKAVTLGMGITSMPGVRSTEGQFPYWLGVDDRLTADEFMRPSYTTGLWLKGDLADGLKYMGMIANNMSTLGVSASQIDNDIATQTLMLVWMPTTKEYGYLSTFGDFDQHEKVATRFGGHWTHSREEKQTQPNTNGIENTQIRLTDGNVIFEPGLFGPGINIERVSYQMASFDFGVKYHGMSLEGEFYKRHLSNFVGPGVAALNLADIDDTGYQMQASAMVIPKHVQLYVGGSQIFGDRFGDASELRAGANWYLIKSRGIRVNGEWLHLNNCPVGYTAVPYPVGGNGNVFHANFEMNF